MTRMPALFVGHGSPMNAIEDNLYTGTWRNLAERIPKPEAILSFSAHWYTKGTRIMNQENPKTIYDMYGFPRKLYEVKYNTAGSSRLAELSKELITSETEYDGSWGIDHGTWSVLVHMYPERDIPVFQISIDADAPPAAHFEIGKELAALREKGVLLFGTGNIVHNLRLVDWNKAGEGFDWAYEFDEYINDSIFKRKHEDVINFGQAGDAAKLAVPTPDHFYPLLYVLGASDDDDKVSVHNKSGELGSLTMTSYLWE